jgi:hypothetical protein
VELSPAYGNVLCVGYTKEATMMRMFFIVKGNRSDAETQGGLRNINLEVDTESDNHNETHCYASIIDRLKITAWYGEGRGILAQPGELLWYTYVEE